jgi:hypothetical protein
MPHETKGVLRNYQRAIIDRIERAIANPQGEKIPVLITRQGGKNETAAQVEKRALDAYAGVPGSILVRTAPTYKPQIVNSKHRLELFLKATPWLRRRWRRREGYIFEVGHAQVHFLSTSPTAQVVGATASIALDVDEAHKVDAGKFEEDFGPFTASTNAPTILWGVAADETDMLHEYREKARGTDRLLEFPAEVIAELSPAYAAHYATRVEELGEDHPVILTQYRLIPIAAIGGYLREQHRRVLFSGDHPQLEGPRQGMKYFMAVDIGGESEEGLDDEGTREAEPDRDSTIIWILEVDQRDDWRPYPMVRVVAGYWYTGRLLTDSGHGDEDVSNLICDHIRHWNVVGGVIDARGVGEAVAGQVHRRHPIVKPYKATSPTVSEDCYDLLARINTGNVKFYRADPNADPIRREMEAQARHTRYEIRNHDQMRLTKPKGSGSSSKHIDFVKALTYIKRALVGAPSGGASSHDQVEERGRFDPFAARRAGRR